MGMPAEYENVVFREAHAGELDWLTDQLVHMGRRRQELLERQFGPGDATVIGVTPDGSEVIFHVWLSRESLAFDLLGPHVGPKDVSTRRLWVSPAHRRRGIASKGLRFVDCVAAEKSYESICAFVEERNVPSRGLHEGLGYEDYGRIVLRSRFGRKFARVRCRGDQTSRRVTVASDVITL